MPWMLWWRIEAPKLSAASLHCQVQPARTGLTGTRLLSSKLSRTSGPLQHQPLERTAGLPRLQGPQANGQMALVLPQYWARPCSMHATRLAATALAGDHQARQEMQIRGICPVSRMLSSKGLSCLHQAGRPTSDPCFKRQLRSNRTPRHIGCLSTILSQPLPHVKVPSLLQVACLRKASGMAGLLRHLSTQAHNLEATVPQASPQQA